MSAVEPSAPWWRARSLAERTEDEPRPGPDSELVAEWREDLPQPALLDERLRAAGAEPATLAGLLSARREPPPGERTPPPWWSWLEDVLDRPAAAPGRPNGDGRLARGCLHLIRPLRLAARAELERAGRRLGNEGPVPFRPGEAATALARAMAADLAGLCAPVVMLEMQAAGLAGELSGDSPEERAAGFMDELSQPGRRRTLLAENPALARLLCDRTRLQTAAAVELLERLTRDQERIAGELCGDDLGLLTGVTPLGDSHSGGRRVLGLRFHSGAELVYKPRSLTADAAWARLLARLNDDGLEPRARPPLSLVTGPEHGWQEQVRPRPCDTPEAVGRYFLRLGAQLALLHGMRAVDFHQENVIACGEHPMVVDLEGLFHPRLGGVRADVVDPLVAETGMDCVLRVGLLPRADVAFGVDISGLGRDPGGRPSVKQASLVGSGTDAARLEERQVELTAEHNAVRLGSRLVRPADWLEELSLGFSCAHRVLRRHRDELLGPGGALAAFRDAETRVILRPTRAYAELIREQVTRPPALADGLARERVLNRLWRGAERRPELRDAAPAEHHDLWRGDVPKFTGRPGAGDVTHHALGALPGMLAPFRFESVDCVRRLDEEDEERQLAFLRCSVLAAAVHPARAPRRPESGPPPTRARLLAAAERCRRRLTVLALSDGEAVGWLSPQPIAGQPGQVLRPAGPGLAEGQAGIALFLAHVGAWDSVRAALMPIPGEPSERLGPGFADGAGGIAWALARIARLGADPGLGERAARLVLGTEPGETTELRSGTAGLGLGLAATLEAAGTGALRSHARACATQLAEVGSPPGERGLAAGDCGRALALHRLGRVLADRRLVARAAELASAEAQLLVSGRDGSVECGSAGAALVLTGLAADGRADRELLVAAARAALTHGLGRDHSLASGDLGVLLAVIAAGRTARDDELVREAVGMTGSVLDEVEAGQARYPGPAPVERPGLFGGLAGLGLAWLSLSSRW